MCVCERVRERESLRARTIATGSSIIHNRIGADGAESLAGVLEQCPALAHLDLGYSCRRVEYKYTSMSTYTCICMHVYMHPGLHQAYEAMRLLI